MKDTITVTRELVTPKIASMWLEKIEPAAQRDFRPSHHKKLEADMLSGTFTPCVTPITFYIDGALADGQHRLWAVLTSKRPQTFNVMRGLPRPAGLNIDTGLPRTVVDAARIASGAEISYRMVAFSRGCEEGNHSHEAHSHSHKLSLINKHWGAVEFAAHHVPRTKYLGASPIGAAVARAWYHEPSRERLIEWCHVLRSGMPSGDEDTAAVAFRNYVLARGAAGSNTAHWRSTFLRAQQSIKVFCRRKASTKAQPPRGDQNGVEPYPLLTDVKEAA